MSSTSSCCLITALLHLWMEASDTIQWARILSVLAFGVTVFLVGHLGIRLGGLRCGLVAALLAATNPLMISAALDARPYALSALTATASVIAAFDGSEETMLGGCGGSA